MKNPKRCSIKFCKNKKYYFDMCQKHYKQSRDHGMAFDIHTGKINPNTNIINKIAARCNQDDTCMVWTGHTVNGHPRMQIAGKGWQLRRWIYENHYNVELEPAELIVTTCGTDLCVNPLHSKCVTSTSIQRKSRAKLTAAEVTIIRMDIALGTHYNVIARQYGVSPATIYSIATGRTWRIG